MNTAVPSSPVRRAFQGRLSAALVRDAAIRYLRAGPCGPDAALEKRIDEIGKLADRTVRPAFTLKRFTVHDGAIAGGLLRIDGSAALSRHLDGCEVVYLVCGTLGTGFDALQRTLSVTSASDALIVQAIGAALTEKLMDIAEEEIRGELSADESTVSRYSPGYGDFPLEAQKMILDLLDTPRRIGVSLTDAMLMVPSKSVSAVIGVRRTDVTS